MLSVKRLEEIMRMLERNASVDVASLSSYFGVSSKTIRQDLTELEKKGLLERVHGGAVLKKSEDAVFPIKERKQTNLDEKKRIANAALKFINDGDTIILDGGTTTLELAKQLGSKPLVVITNDLLIASELLPKELITLYITGGKLRREGVYTLLGRDAERMFGKYHAHKVFLATSALDFNQGLMVLSEDESAIKQSMIKAAQEVICLADYSKFHKMALVPFAPLTKINRLITDDRIPDSDRVFLTKAGIDLQIV